MSIHHGLPEVKLIPKTIKDLSFLEEVERGRQGTNAGLIGSLKLNKRLNGVQEGRYYLIGAHPNIGKTQFVDYFFVFNTWLQAKTENRDIVIFYCSLELSATMKKAKWCSMYLYWKYGTLWTTDFILGRIPGKDSKPSDDDMILIQEAYAFVELMLHDVRLLDKPMTPLALTNYLADSHYSLYGTVVRANVTKAQQDKGIKGDIVAYQRTKTVPFTMVIIDHLAYMKGKNVKETMDEASRLLVIFRNLLGLTAVVVQQLNQELTKSRRDALVRHGKDKVHDIIAPQQLDFGDSTYTYRDADYVMGFVKPAKFDLDSFDGFSCELPSLGGLGDCLIVAYLLKNRYGNVDFHFPMFMNGIAGFFYDLPDELEPDMEDWIKLAQKLING